MFCHKCGTKIEEGTKFCQSCGGKITDTPNNEPLVPFNNEALFYSTDWRRIRILVVASVPYFDVMTDNEYLYLIKLPNYHSGSLGMVIGLMFASLVGAVIGAAIGNSSDVNSRKNYRASWLDHDQKLFSDYYHNAIFLKIPLNQLKNNLVLKGNKLILNWNDQKITLKKSAKECERLNKCIEKYVL